MGSATFPAPQRRNDHRFGERQPLSHRLLIRRERLQDLPHAQQGRRHRRSGRLNRKNP
jgi:hypothetical protein